MLFNFTDCVDVVNCAEMVGFSTCKNSTGFPCLEVAQYNSRVTTAPESANEFKLGK